MKIHACKLADSAPCIAPSRGAAIVELARQIRNADPANPVLAGELQLIEREFPGVSGAAGVVAAYDAGYAASDGASTLEAITTALTPLATDDVTTKTTLVGFIREGQVFAAGVKLPATLGEGRAVETAPAAEATDAEVPGEVAPAPPVAPRAAAPSSMPASPFQPSR